MYNIIWESDSIEYYTIVSFYNLSLIDSFNSLQIFLCLKSGRLISSNKDSRLSN